jgi:chromosome segregation ATPase
VARTESPSGQPADTNGKDGAGQPGGAKKAVLARSDLSSTAPAAARSPRYSPRKIAVAALAVALLAGVAGSTTWAVSKSNALSRSQQQLASAEADLAGTQSQLALAHSSYNALNTAARQADRRYNTTKAQLAQTKRQLGATKRELSQARGQLSQSRAQLGEARDQLGATKSLLGQTQDRLGQAQDRLGETQSQLGQTKSSLTSSQSHGAQCEQAASLGARDSQLLATFIQVENVFLNAAKAGNKATMQTDLNQMQGLSDQVQAIGPQFTSAVERCTGI